MADKQKIYEPDELNNPDTIKIITLLAENFRPDSDLDEDRLVDAIAVILEPYYVNQTHNDEDEVMERSEVKAMDLITRFGDSIEDRLMELAQEFMLEKLINPVNQE